MSRLGFSKHTRGYFGLVLYRPKTHHNVGSLIRTADILGVSMLVTVGARYQKQPSDTYSTTKRVPMLHFEDWETFLRFRPHDALLVGAELTADATDLRKFHHPERALYVLGAEDDGLPPSVLKSCNAVVRLAGNRSMNVAVAGSIVLYHREGLQRAREESVRGAA
jgi:tRNA G18 (ribose-2'-O)-methylase SpoU